MTISVAREAGSTAREAVRAPRGVPASAEPGDGIDVRFVAYRNSGDGALRTGLIEDNRPLAVHCAARFAHRGERRDDLIQVAMVGLCKAVDRFDPDVGARFTTFAVPTIVGELRRHFRDTTWPVHVTRRAKDLYQSLDTTIAILVDSLGRSPTVAEIAHCAGASETSVVDALELAYAYRTVPYPQSDGDGDGEGGAPLGRHDRGYDAVEARCTVRQLLEALPTERDRTVVRLRFIDDLSQTEIAARVGTSQVHVSRLLRRNLERMQYLLARGIS